MIQEKKCNDELADGTNIQFASNHKRNSVRPDEKKLPHKTESVLSKNPEDVCILCFKTIVGNDDCCYIKRKLFRVNDPPNKIFLHMNHIKIPKQKRQFMTK